MATAWMVGSGGEMAPRDEDPRERNRQWIAEHPVGVATAVAMFLGVLGLMLALSSGESASGVMVWTVGLAVLGAVGGIGVSKEARGGLAENLRSRWYVAILVFMALGLLVVRLAR